MGRRSVDWPSLYLHIAQRLEPGVTLCWNTLFLAVAEWWKGGRQVAGLNLSKQPEMPSGARHGKKALTNLVLVLCSELVPCPANTGERGSLTLLLFYQARPRPNFTPLTLSALEKIFFFCYSSLPAAAPRCDLQTF